MRKMLRPSSSTGKTILPQPLSKILQNVLKLISQLRQRLLGVLEFGKGSG